MNIKELSKKALELRDKLIISNHRETIQYVFNTTNNPNENDIKTRLIVIDSLFSTNILKNHGALEELSKTICEITNSNDENMIQYILKYLENEQPSLLFDKKFGFKNKRALSLISKYCFFLLKEEFPIFDKFVRKFVKKMTNITEPTIFDIKNFVQKLNISYNEFDVIAWIYGKISENTYLYGMYDNKITQIENKQEFEDFKKNVDLFLENNLNFKIKK